MKVYALKDNVQKFIRHAGGTKFNKEGVADWPNDQFTRRRIRDGDISTEPPGEKKALGKPAAKSPAQT